jgi:hypothetical protein
VTLSVGASHTDSEDPPWRDAVKVLAAGTWHAGHGRVKATLSVPPHTTSYVVVHIARPADGNIGDYETQVWLHANLRVNEERFEPVLLLPLDYCPSTHFYTDDVTSSAEQLSSAAVAQRVSALGTRIHSAGVQAAWQVFCPTLPRKTIVPM